jgi:uncharacterized protein YodC (DUF2158 family)
MEIKIGDVVNLKSDKVNKMTVEDIVGDTFKCIWFDCTIELQIHDFKPEVLELSSVVQG